MNWPCYDSKSIWMAWLWVFLLAGLLVLFCSCSDSTRSDQSLDMFDEYAYVSGSPTAIPEVYGHYEAIPSGVAIELDSFVGLGEDIRDLAMDAKGRLWVATHSGLGMWDGAQWLLFTAENSSLPQDDVRSVSVAPDGETVWVGTAAGIARYEKENWRVFTHENSALSSPVIEEIVFDRYGKVWAATSFGGVAVFGGERWSYFDKYNSGLLGLSVSTLTAGSDGRIWLVDDFGDGLSEYDGVEWEQFSEGDSGLISNWVDQIVVDADGRPWFVSEGQVNGLDGESWSRFDLQALYEEGFYFKYLALASDDRVWVVGFYNAQLVVHRLTNLDTGNQDVETYAIPDTDLSDWKNVNLPGQRLDEWGNPIPTRTECPSPTPQTLLPVGEEAWLGTSFGLFHLFADGDVEAVPLPNSRPPKVSDYQETLNSIDDFFLVYEFHTDHIRLLTVGTVQVGTSYQVSSTAFCDQGVRSDLYSSQDVVEFRISENITICEGANLGSLFRPIDPPSIGEEYTYWMSEAVHRLPHLHSPHPIEPGHAYHFGLRTRQAEEHQNWLTVLAFPASADILQVDGSVPTAEVMVDGWRFFVYDRRIAVRPHVRFAVNADLPSPLLETYLDMLGWRQQDSQ